MNSAGLEPSAERQAVQPTGSAEEQGDASQPLAQASANNNRQIQSLSHGADNHRLQSYCFALAQAQVYNCPCRPSPLSAQSTA